MTARRAPGLLLAATLLVVFPVAALGDDDHRGRHRQGGWKTPRGHGARAPVVVARPPVAMPPRHGYVLVPGHYETREEIRYVPGPAETVWVPPRFGLTLAEGRLLEFVLAPGHYVSRPGPLVPVRELVRVWVPDRWAPAGRVVDSRRRPH